MDLPLKSMDHGHEAATGAVMGWAWLQRWTKPHKSTALRPPLRSPPARLASCPPAGRQLVKRKNVRGGA